MDTSTAQEEEEMEQSQMENQLVQNETDERYTGDGSVDVKGNPVPKKNTGKWGACKFILGTECCERLAYYGIAANLVTYLTDKLHESNASAATRVTTWSGTCYITPLVGALLADAYLGRFLTIAIFSTIYFIGMCTLTLSASISALKPAACVGSVCPSATTAQHAMLFVGLYMIALGTGGIKPCVSSFGADQFDDTDPIEKVKKGAFFNWFYFSITMGSLVSSTFIVWIQDNVGWGWGFGIPALFMGIAVVSFFSGSFRYRFQKPGGSPITRLCQVLVAALRKRKLKVPEEHSLLYETTGKGSGIEGSRKLEHTDELKWLDKAAVVSDGDINSNGISNRWRVCTVTQVEELKLLIRMLPIWATGIVYGTVFVQKPTFYVEQGHAMDRTIGSFTIPSASLTTFFIATVIILVPIYERVLVPIARKLTGEERGFTVLQKMGIGLVISTFSLLAAAIVEKVRLQKAKEVGDDVEVVPLSIFWQIPQYSLLGAADVFTFVGQMEFFYDQSPDAMRSVCSALSLFTGSLGSYLSTLIVTIVTSITTAGGKVGWIPAHNLNKGHLDYYFVLVAGISALNFVVYVFCARRYKKKAATT